jgi:hypothetical protein
MPKALRAEINDVVVKYRERELRKGGTLDVAVTAHEMTQSLVDGYHKFLAHFKSRRRCQMLLRLVLAVEGPDLDQPAAMRVRLRFDLSSGL